MFSDIEFPIATVIFAWIIHILDQFGFKFVVAAMFMMSTFRKLGYFSV